MFKLLKENSVHKMAVSNKNKISNQKRYAFLISPSGYSGKKLLNNAIKILKNWNFEVNYLPDIIDKYHYYAGDYKRRAKEINLAYNDKNSKFIFSIIGGMGAVHTLLFLDYDLIKKSNKTLIGYSDITILLNTIYQKTGKRCLHGPNLWKPIKKYHEKTILCLFDAINKKNYQIAINNQDILKQGFARADIAGGNLTLLERSLGTNYEINTNNKILFIEDVKMKEGWVLDILWHLKLAGKFNNVKGIILGNFVDCGKNINNYLKDFFQDFKCPVIMNQPIGHSEPNLTIPLGETCIIDTKNKFWKIQFKKDFNPKPI